MKRWRADLALVLITAIWGSTFIIVKNALDSVGPLLFVATRFWVASLPLALLVWMRRDKVRHAGSNAILRDGLVTGLFLTLGFVTQTIGLQTTEAGKAAFITGLYVVMVPLFAAVILRAPPSSNAVVGTILAAIGLGLITLNRALRLAPGDIWVLACAVAFAFQIIATARYTHRHSALLFTLVQLLTAALLTTLAALLFERPLVVPPAGAWPAILYVGLGATGLVFVLQTWAQRHTTPTHTALLFSLEPVFAVVFAVLFGGEALTPKEWAGAALILAGMLAAELGGLRRWRRRKALQRAERAAEGRGVLQQ